MKSSRCLYKNNVIEKYYILLKNKIVIQLIFNKFSNVNIYYIKIYAPFKINKNFINVISYEEKNKYKTMKVMKDINYESIKILRKNEIPSYLLNFLKEIFGDMHENYPEISYENKKL
jgi:hypothetical protein